MGSFFPFLNIYYRELGFTGRQIGTLSVFFPVMSLIFATPISALADRKHWRIRVLQGGIVIEAIFVFLLKYPVTYPLVALNLVFMAVAFSPVMSIADSLIINMATNDRLNYGSMRLWGSIGFAASATIFGMVWQRYRFESMFLIGSLLMVPLFISAGSLDEGKNLGSGEHVPILSIFKDPGLVILILVSFLMGISNALSMSYEGIFVTTLGGGNMLVGMMIGVSGVSEILTMQNGQAIAERLRNANTLILSLVMMGISNVGYVLAGSPLLMVPMAALKGLGFGLFFINIVRIVHERAPKDWVTTAQSLRAVAMFGVAQLVAGPLGGLVLDHISPSAIFGIGAVALGMGVLLVWIAKQKKIFD
jgi:PPP family 3-phenylpropionic acid transporter